MTDFLPPTAYDEAAAAVRQRTALQPKIGLVLGSGLSSLADAVTDPDIIPFGEIPHWPTSTVHGHSGRLVIGKLEGRPVIVLQGRVHFYEGYSPAQITLPMRVMRRLGVETVILTNAAGGTNPNYKPGDLMVIKDHLNLPGIAGQNPLRGPNDDNFGPRFPDMSQAYDKELRRLAHETAVKLGFRLQEGVYAFVAGPSYETPAELRFLQIIGADAVGMSTAPSAVVARHAGMRVLGISTITNLALPDPPPDQVTSHEEVLEVGKLVVPRLSALIQAIVSQL
jgi:purine-nucleoside phosphorylase